MSGQDEQHGSSLLGFGLEKLGLASLYAPVLAAFVTLVLTGLAVQGFLGIKVDDSLSELFRTNTPQFRQYEEIDRRFPSSEYDVLAVIEGPKLLERPQLEAFVKLATELNLTEGLNGIVSMVSARGKPDAKGYAPPIVSDELPEPGPDYDAMIKTLRENEIVAGKFLSGDGTLALIVISLDRAAVAEHGSREIIGGITKTAEQTLAGTGLSVKLTGAPVMQLEIRNAVEQDQMVYNGLGALFGAGVAVLFFRSLSLMLLAVVPPILAVVWSLGLMGWIGIKLNLFLNVMTPLVMVMGFADSMQMVSAMRIRLREGDDRREAMAFAVRVVGPACVLAHLTALVSFLALLISDSALIRTFGIAGALATGVSYIAVLGVLPVLGQLLIRKGDRFSRERSPSDAAMDWLGMAVGAVVDVVVRRAGIVSAVAIALLVGFTALHLTLEPRYRLADQVPDREQALAATSRLDQKLTGANPVHVMINWRGREGASVSGKHALYDAETLAVIRSAHEVLQGVAGLGNVWSLDSLRRWLAEAGDDRIETVKKYVGVLPQHLVRRFIAEDNTAALVTGRLPDVDASQIVPVVDRIDKALEPIRKAHPDFEIAVTGLPAIAARNSASMIGQLNEALAIEVVLVSALLGIAFRSAFVGGVSLMPGLFPVVAAGAALAVSKQGLEFASVIALIVIFGLGVDGLIHFINRLRREERPGEDPALAIRRARVLVGPAIILTTVVLAFGLGVTAFSALPSLRLFGAVCAMTLAASLVADLVFLPALIALWRRMVRPRSVT